MELVSKDKYIKYTPPKGLVKITSTLKNALAKASDEVDSCSRQTNMYLIEKFGRDCVIAARAYTLNEPPLYEKVNTNLRRLGDMCSRYHFLPYYSVGMPHMFQRFIGYGYLHHNLERLYQKTRPQFKDVILYRGCGVNFSAKINKVVTLCTYTSTSLNRQEAYKFGEKSGTLFKFTGMMRGVSLMEMSSFPAEEEILLFPFQSFVVSEKIKNGNFTEITLLSRTRKAMKIFEKLNKFFPFCLEILEKCLYLVIERENLNMIKTFLNNEEIYCFTGSDLCQFNYKPLFVNYYKSLPPCHIIVISEDTINVHSEPDSKDIILLPNLQTLITCCKKNKKVFVKKIIVRFEPNDLKQFENFEVGCVELWQNTLAKTQILIDYCQKKDPLKTATSFVIGKDLSEIFWTNFLKNGFPKHLHKKMNICIVNEDFSKWIDNPISFFNMPEYIKEFLKNRNN